MRAKNIELSIIKISIVCACLVVGAGTIQRILETRAEPTSNNVVQSSVTTPATATTQTTNTAIPTTPVSTPLGKVIAIGDSYTFGYPYGLDYSWVNLAAKDLKRELINKAKTSQTSADLLKRFQSDVIDGKPDAVIILIGTGDAIRGVSLETYQKNLQDMVKAAKDKNISTIIGLPLPYPDANATKLIADYRTWLTSFAQTEKLKVVDFNPDLVEDGGGIRKGLTDDGKYPNKQGYTTMAQTIEKALK
ncbi:MAG TPA: GDSL-type esterase/lipase family protein [Candidatus Deferrimicrobium sp.]|nr:GDSL-type esterase/lipase family protein [Candidatus Deferrimicrobium sp.]